MATAKQKAAARRNIKKAHAALRRKGRKRGKRKGSHGLAGGVSGLAGRHRRAGRPRKKKRGTHGLAERPSTLVPISKKTFRIGRRKYQIVRVQRKKHLKAHRRKKSS